MPKSLLVLIYCLLLFFTLDGAEGGSVMKLSSPEFKHNEYLPKKFTCQGQRVNPGLVIEDIPAGAKSLVLIMNDPDAVGGDFVHWVLYDLPVTSRIDENFLSAKQGLNSLGRMGYVPPCPPSGTHRYFFRVYALDADLGLPEGLGRDDLEREISDHLMDKAELIGLYKKQ